MKFHSALLHCLFTKPIWVTVTGPTLSVPKFSLHPNQCVKLIIVNNYFTVRVLRTKSRKMVCYSVANSNKTLCSTHFVLHFVPHFVLLALWFS